MWTRRTHARNHVVPFDSGHPKNCLYPQDSPWQGSFEPLMRKLEGNWASDFGHVPGKYEYGRLAGLEEIPYDPSMFLAIWNRNRFLEARLQELERERTHWKDLFQRTPLVMEARLHELHGNSFMQTRPDELEAERVDLLNRYELDGKVKALERECISLRASLDALQKATHVQGSSHLGSIRRNRKAEHLRMPRSAGACRDAPRVIDWSGADPSKWKFITCEYNGSYHYHEKPKLQKISEPIQEGLQKLKKNPTDYEGIIYQTNMVGWPTEQQKYSFVARTGSGFSVDPMSSGGFTWVHPRYETLNPDVTIALDQFTDHMTYRKQKLGKPFRPGRGDGCADVPNLKLIDTVDPNDVFQGSVGDCWLLSAISALAEFEGAITHLFRKTGNIAEFPKQDSNTYVVTLHDLTKWTPVDIVIDERLCNKADGSGLLGCTPSITGELWACYLEKAAAIHCGGWDAIDGGHCTHAWRLLTGCKYQYTIRKKRGTEFFECLGTLNPNTGLWEQMANSPHEGFNGLWSMPWPEVGGSGNENVNVDENGLFERMCAWDDHNYIMACATKGGSDSHSTDGIVDGHAYTILRCINDAGGTNKDMLKVRNPWGHGEFTVGTWDDDGPGWDQFPQVKEACQPVQADDGVFWMDRTEFFKHFKTIYLCANDMSKFAHP